MSIQELSSKFKGFQFHTDYLLAILILIVSCLSFYLGRSSMRQKPESAIQTLPTVINSTETHQSFTSNTETSTPQTEPKPLPVDDKQGTYVGSKKGTKYHLPWCAGAKRIKEENKIWFSTKEDAQKAGYTPATNCKGI